jgi:hypothetical protein
MTTATRPLRRTLQVLAGFFTHRQPSADEAYLSRATDIADLERRMQQIEREPVTEAEARLSFMAYSRP